MASFQTYFRSAFNSLRSSNSGSGGLLQQARNLSGAELTAAGVVLAEVIGFFSLGEMIGRFKVVGYRSAEHGQQH